VTGALPLRTALAFSRPKDAEVFGMAMREGKLTVPLDADLREFVERTAERVNPIAPV
jgi:hypothetical protein